MIIIGDIHGQYDLLMNLFENLPHDNVCFVGDLIDRGPNSKDVVEFVKSNNYHCVLGNHEDFMIQAYDEERKQNYDVYKMWEYNGCEQTEYSYYETKCGQRFYNADLFFEHREWMKTLPLVYWVNKNTVVSHSRCLPFIGNDLYNVEDKRENVLWSRLHKVHTTNGIINIHGHTITNKVFCYNNYINIDTGSYKNNILTAYDTDVKVCFQINNSDFVKFDIG